MTLSIVIVSWNTCGLLEQCISSIIRHLAKGSYEIVVVDNASSDQTDQMLHDHFPEVKVICNSTNQGFARANNQGIRHCSGEKVLLLNPDTDVKENALIALQRALDENPGIGAVGPRLLNPDGTLQPSCFPLPTLFREIWRLFHLDKIHPLANYPMASWDLHLHREVETLNGACLMIKREALDEVGDLDEAYYIYSEEVDLCYRLYHAGWKLVWVPEAEVVHYGGQSTRQNRSEMFQHLYRSKIIYFRKNHGRSAANIYKAILVATSLARLVFTPFYLFIKDPKRQEFLQLVKNYRVLLSDISGM